MFEWLFNWHLFLEWLLGRLWVERAGLVRPVFHLGKERHLLYGGRGVIPLLLLLLQLELGWWEVALLLWLIG